MPWLPHASSGGMCSIREPSETINQYMASPWTAALYCEFHNLDEVLLDQLVCGVKDIKLQCHLLAQKELNLQSTMDEARASEMSDKSTAEIHRFQSMTTPPSRPITVHHD